MTAVVIDAGVPQFFSPFLLCCQSSNRSAQYHKPHNEKTRLKSGFNNPETIKSADQPTFQCQVIMPEMIIGLKFMAGSVGDLPNNVKRGRMSALSLQLHKSDISRVNLNSAYSWNQ
jgi:hypothetical protein